MALEGGDGGRLGRGEGIRANSLGRTKEGIRGRDIGERVEGMGNGGVCWGVVELKGKSKAVKKLE